MMFQEQIDLLQQKGLYRSLKSVGYIDRQYIEVEIRDVRTIHLMII